MSKAIESQLEELAGTIDGALNTAINTMERQREALEACDRYFDEHIQRHWPRTGGPRKTHHQVREALAGRDGDLEAAEETTT